MACETSNTLKNDASSCELRETLWHFNIANIIPMETGIEKYSSVDHFLNTIGL